MYLTKNFIDILKFKKIYPKKYLQNKLDIDEEINVFIVKRNMWKNVENINLKKNCIYKLKSRTVLS